MAPDGRRRSVLVVDDDASYREALAAGLSGEGYTVYLAPDGRSALRLCATRTPDVVLLDLRLPDLSGTEVCNQARLDGLSHKRSTAKLAARCGP